MIIIALMLSLVSCIGGGRKTHEKNSTATFRSDNEDYVIPGVYIDVQEGENHDKGKDYGELYPID